MSKSKKPKKPEPEKMWDEYAIKAEIRRNGQTLTSLARANGYEPSTFRAAFKKPISGANRAMAQYLGQPVQALWPKWFDDHGELIPARQRNSTHKIGSGERPERVAA
ncbi:helix-turn-helix domain-containing protein [Aestuariivirga sp. YIM B02566]|uniref:Helix-turn-helix domain-containing protein n=1 Tax=Taklimakanibacter albus TaxID=2800327 RepID=A0ACC5R6Q5_9HYPH|nr:helix-turn-helix domain-containing protein [Aestuariivirga sp. YIM B02566]MBK1868290.1 helix-turn-helix domain-containing protein [Aestuariivirga sp. YIM B02566]